MTQREVEGWNKINEYSALIKSKHLLLLCARTFCAYIYERMLIQLMHIIYFPTLRGQGVVEGGRLALKN